MTDPVSTRDFYLHDIALNEALATWHSALEQSGLLQPLGKETIALSDAHRRVTAEPVWARISSPHYHAAAMDGYAVRAEDTRGATETSPRRLRIGDEAIPVDTGDPLPPSMDTVIMIEDTQLLSGGRESEQEADKIEILAASAPWTYVRPMGEDIVATELVLPANHRLRPQDLGALAAAGHKEVPVYRQPRIAILPTGSELVAPGSDLRPGNIIESNSLMLAAQAEEAGCRVTRLPIVADSYDDLKGAVTAALKEHDLVAINAGSSAGSEDYTAQVVRELGTLYVHGIAMRPGHPVVLGMAQGRALVGIPGYPVSASVTFDRIVTPLFYRWQGQVPPQRESITATLSRKLASPMGEDHFVRVTLGKVGKRVIATPLPGGAGVIMSLVKADGFLTVPRFSEGHQAGSEVRVDLLRPAPSIERTIVVIGSHDMTLDVLTDHMTRRSSDITVSSAHVGSLGGLLALQRRDAHVAGSHLLDENTGEYNVSYIERLLVAHGISVILLGFVDREQGLLVPKGNPKSIQTLEDLLRDDIVFINRQRGAGTRVLLDHMLAQRNLDPRAITGYTRQEYTHLAVAAAVKSGAADCGIGILAAARALDLTFVPLFTERYDLVIPTEHYDSELLAPLLALLREPDSDFRQAVMALGGYGIENMGRVLAEL